MSSMPAMPMPGGWKMSMAWVRMPGQTRLAEGASLVGMWTVMMVAMMTPSLIPMLQRYRRAIGWLGGTALGQPTAMAGLGYYLVWNAFGIALIVSGIALASIAMRFALLARAVPVAARGIMVIAGGFQFTRWKARHLAGCREDATCEHALDGHAPSAFRHGLRLGVHCACCCAGLMAILVAVGLMDLRAMILVTGAITAERLAPSGEQVARAIGAVAIGAGVLLIAGAIGRA
ncbi:MAG TPA: DUF2182 domain-containing protein [Gemmatimonadaceae bacterium]